MIPGLGPRWLRSRKEISGSEDRLAWVSGLGLEGLGFRVQTRRHLGALMIWVRVLGPMILEV